MQTYEIIIYNEEVRQCLREGDKHRTFSDDWGDSHYIEFKGEDEAEAVAKCNAKYPPEDGFVIEGVSLA